jgi:TRAP-type mannitol/chloroaromatic compound transport system permease small subunit
MKKKSSEPTNSTKWMTRVVLGLGIVLIIMAGLSYITSTPTSNTPKQVKEANPFE